MIPVYQGGAALLECLSSVEASSPAPDWTVVVDNASTDGAVEDVVRRYPWVEVIRNPENRGFGMACNQGIERTFELGADYILLLNQDARLEPGTLASMVSLAQSEPRAAAVGCRTLSPPVGVGAPTLLYAGSWKTWLPLWQRIPGIGQPAEAAPSEPCMVHYVWGHAMLLRAAAVRSVGSFDPGFFMYYEDLDLCDRLQSAGWTAWSDNRVVVWHAVPDAGRSKQSESWRWQMKSESSRIFYRRRHGRLGADLLWILTGFREAIHLAGHARWPALRHLLHAIWLVLQGAPPARPPFALPTRTQLGGVATPPQDCR